MRQWSILLIGGLGLVLAWMLLGNRLFRERPYDPEPPIPIYAGAIDLHDTGYYPSDSEHTRLDKRTISFRTPDALEQVRDWYDQQLAGVWFEDFYGFRGYGFADREYGSLPYAEGFAPYTFGLTITRSLDMTEVTITLKRH